MRLRRSRHAWKRCDIDRVHCRLCVEVALGTVCFFFLGSIGVKILAFSVFPGFLLEGFFFSISARFRHVSYGTFVMKREVFRIEDFGGQTSALTPHLICPAKPSTRVSPPQHVLSAESPPLSLSNLSQRSSQGPCFLDFAPRLVPVLAWLHLQRHPPMSSSTSISPARYLQ